MSVINTLKQLAATSSRNEKVAVLSANKDSEDLKRFFYLALDPFVTFGIKKIPGDDAERGTTKTLGWAFDELEPLMTRELTGHAAIRHLQMIMSRLSTDDVDVLCRVIQKDPSCGVSDATVNTVWPNLVTKFPVMKATAMDEKSMKAIKYPAYSQRKVDGARCVIIYENGKIKVLSSSGKEIHCYGLFDHFVSIIEGTGELTKDKKSLECVFDGELVYRSPTGFADRKTGNGKVNSAIAGKLSEKEAENLHFVAFDWIPLKDWYEGKCETPYRDRFSTLKHYHQWMRGYHVSIVETETVFNEDQAIKHFKKLYDRGEEGTILKNTSAIWEDKRSKNQIKLKGILSCDLQVTDFVPGTGKYTGMIGALVCKSSDDLLEVNVGTGLSDEDRSRDPSYYVGKIVEVMYNERIKSKVDDKKWSLFLPRLGEVRFDKLEADGLDQISIKGK